MLPTRILLFTVAHVIILHIRFAVHTYIQHVLILLYDSRIRHIHIYSYSTNHIYLYTILHLLLT